MKKIGFIQKVRKEMIFEYDKVYRRQHLGLEKKD
jgi:hypothetical protein